MVSSEPLGFDFVCAMNTRGYKPIDHAPCPMAVVAQAINALSVRWRKTVSLSGVQSQLRAHSRPGKVGGRRAIFRYHQEIKRGSGIIFTRRQRNENDTYAVVRVLHRQSYAMRCSQNKPPNSRPSTTYPSRSREVSPETHLPWP